MKRKHTEAAHQHARDGLLRAYDWRDMPAESSREIVHDATVLREVMRLHTLGRTPDDIGTLLGLNPGDIRMLLYGPDDPNEEGT